MKFVKTSTIKTIGKAAIYDSLSGNNYRDATLSELYLTVTEITIKSLKKCPRSKAL